MRREFAVQTVNEVLKDKALSGLVVDKLIDEGIIDQHYGNQAVSGVVEAFKTYFGTTKASRYDRYASKRLTDKHGADTVIKVIQVLSAKAEDKYCPTVNSVAQLEDKWVQVIRFLKTNQKEVID